METEKRLQWVERKLQSKKEKIPTAACLWKEKSGGTVAKGDVGPKYGLFPYDGRNIILLNIDVKLMNNRNGV